MANDLDLNLKITADGVDAKAALSDVNAQVLALGDSSEQAGQKADVLGTSVEQSNEKVGTLGATTNETSGFFTDLKDRLVGIVDSGFNLFVDHAVHGLIMLTARTAMFGVELRESISQEKAFADASRMFEGTSDEINNLNNQLKDLAVTKIPVPYEEIAHLAKLAGSMGKSMDEVAGFITTASEAALSFNTPADEMMQSLGGIQTAIKLTNDQLPTFTDQVKAAADSAKGMSTEAGIMSVMADGVAQAGKQLGLAAGESVAFSSAMLDTNGNVNNSASALFGLFTSFTNVKGESVDFHNSLIRLGTSADKFATDVKTKPVQAITQLLEKLRELEPASQADIIKGLVGENQNKQAAVTQLTQGLDVLKQQLKATSDETIYAGGVHEAYEKKLETTDAKLEFLGNSFKLLGAAIANPFLPAIKLAVDGLTNLTDWFRKTTENSPFLEILQKSTFLFLGLGGSIRLVSLLFTPVVAGLGLMLRGFSTLAPIIITTTERIFAYAASLRVMAAAQLASFSSSASAGFSFAGMLGKVGTAARTLGIVFKELVGGTFGLIGLGITALVVSLSYLSDKFSTVGKTSAKNSEIAWASFSVFFKNILAGFKPVIDLFSEAGTVIVGVWNDITGGTLKFTSIWDLAVKGFEANANFTIGIWQFFGQSVGIIFAALVEQVSININAIDDILSGAGLQNSLDKRAKLIDENGKRFVDSMKQSGKDAFETNHIQNFKNQVEEEIKTSRQAEKPKANPAQRDPLTGEISQPVVTDTQTKKRLTAIQAEVKTTDDLITASQTHLNESAKQALEQRKADIELLGGTQLQKEFLVTQAVKAASDAQLLITKTASDGKIAAIDTAYKEVFSKATLATDAEKQLNAQGLKDKAEVYNATAKTYSTMIDGLIAEEIKLTQRSKTLADERRGIEQSYADFKAQLAQASFTDAQKLDAEKAKLDAMVLAQKKADRKGDSEESARLNAEILELGKKLALSEAGLVASHSAANKRFAETGKGLKDTYIGSVDSIVEITDKAQKNLLATNATAQSQNQARLNDVKNSAEQAKNELASVQAQIERINAQLQANHTLTITPEAQAVYDAIERIKQPTESTHTINVVETRTQAHATGGYIYHYAGGGYTRKHGAITGAGTGTSDEIPAMLSNGEYVLTAKTTSRIGKKTLDAANYDEADLVPVKKYAGGGSVGDDKYNQRLAELKKKQYEDVVAVFNNPGNQVAWSMSKGQTTVGADVHLAKRNFEMQAGDYLKQHGLPQEFYQWYIAGIDANKVLNDTKASLAEKMQASAKIDSLQNKFTPQTATPPPHNPAVSLPSSISAPQIPAINQPALIPQVSRLAEPVISSSATSMQSSRVSTVKFESASGKATTGHSADPDFAKFFDDLQTVGGVTRI